MILALFQFGGPIVQILFGLSIVAGGITIAKALTLHAYRRRLARGTPCETEAALSEAALDLTRGLTALRLIGTSSPLLGLLGTVIGLLEAFQAVARSGLGDPSLFADGIALALTTTTAGLIVALPALAAHQLLLAGSERILVQLERGGPRDTATAEETTASMRLRRRGT